MRHNARQSDNNSSSVQYLHSKILRKIVSRSENEDEYEFVCLIIIRMRNCPWHVTQAENSLPDARRQQNFEEK